MRKFILYMALLVVTIGLNVVLGSSVEYVGSEWSEVGGIQIAVAHDTTAFTATKMWRAPGGPGSARPVEPVYLKPDGVVMFALKPFRYKAFGKNGTDATMAVPVDTCIQSGTVGNFSVKYVCWTVVPMKLDSLKLWPAGSDTIWYRTLFK